MGCHATARYLGRAVSVEVGAVLFRQRSGLLINGPQQGVIAGIKLRCFCFPASDVETRGQLRGDHGGQGEAGVTSSGLSDCIAVYLGKSYLDEGTREL